MIYSARMVERVRIEKVVDGGFGLGRDSSGVVLLPGALAGETVDADLAERRMGIRTGRVRDVVDASSDRRAPECPLFLDCGGCDFLHTAYEKELELKQAILAETFQRIGKLTPPFLSPVPSSSPEFYRDFVQLKINPDGRIGLFRKDSHEVVPFEGPAFGGCRLQKDRLNRAVAVLQGKLTGFQVVKFRMGDEGFVVNLTAEQPPEGRDELEPLIRSLGVTGFLINDRPVYGPTHVLYIYGEAQDRQIRIRVSHDAFFQPNPPVVQAIARRLEETLDRVLGPNRLMSNILDLYAGVGTFGLFLAHAVLGVFAVEVSESATSDMEWNIPENRIRNMVFHRGTAKSFLKRFRGKAGAVILDPPRAGLETAVRDDLIRLAPPLLFYISCHPATLARDLADLTSRGPWRIDSVQLFDQFGRTHHIESLSVLK
ncbi:class I SAM-dependent RNA methyltransferase [bacterium]|nr:class I SAM-dependent RNA methyltransferase [bacterium]